MDQNILFFDGVCHLCNGYINFLIVFKSTKIYFAPLQGTTAQKILISRPDVDSILYYKNKTLLQKSTAVIESLFDTSLFFFWIKIFYVIPRFLRDALYDLIARHRYQIFGQSESCRIPTAAEKKFILP